MINPNLILTIIVSLAAVICISFQNSDLVVINKNNDSNTIETEFTKEKITENIDTITNSIECKNNLDVIEETTNTLE